jgi:hypothetical protein
MEARRSKTAQVIASLLLLAACSRPERSAPPTADAATTTSLPSGSTSPSLAASPPSPVLAAEPAPRVAPVPEKDWTWKAYRGDHFSVLLPGEPKVTTLPEEDDKIGYTEARVEVPGGQVSFAAGFSDFPQSEVDKPETFLDEHASPPRRGLTDVLHKRAISLPGGQPGRVLILRRNISGTPLRVYSRLYLVGRRLYSLIVSTLDVGGVSEDVVKKFMDSFKLT